jgi:omega-6 fatty acid desaturase (delta-12 desaturase)
VFNSIMEHSIHHLRPGVPLYNLAEAQERLEELDKRVVVYRWSGRRHLDICRRCKLFDFDAKRWMDFEGNYTSPPYRAAKIAAVEEEPETADAL